MQRTTHDSPAVQPPGPLDGSKPSTDWSAARQLVFSFLGTLALWGLSMGLLALSLARMFGEGPGSDSTSLLLLAAGLGFFGFLLIPSGAFAFSRLTSTEIGWPGWLKLGTVSKLAVLFPVILLAGHLISSRPALSWALLPPLHILALGLPILWLLWLGSRSIQRPPAARGWVIFAAGLVLGPMAILILEFLIGTGLVVGWAASLARDTAQLDQLLGIMDEVRAFSDRPEALLPILEPYLTSPVVAGTLFVFVAGIVPVIEEAIKPIGVWFLRLEEATPATGFVAGLLSGGAYALFENLALSSQSEEWALAAAARAGTSLLHMITTGLIGWALASAWRDRSYPRVIGSYLAAVALHGSWNGLTLLALTGFVPSSAAAFVALLQPLGAIAPLGLVGLTVLSLGLMVGMNYRLRKTSETAEQHEAVAPPS